MEPEEKKLRTRLQELHDNPQQNNIMEIIDLKRKLINKYGWARGKSLGNNRYNMLEKP